MAKKSLIEQTYEMNNDPEIRRMFPEGLYIDTTGGRGPVILANPKREARGPETDPDVKQRASIWDDPRRMHQLEGVGLAIAVLITLAVLLLCLLNAP